MPPKKRDKENDSSKSTKLENPSLADQESFLQAFEKPTQIYRYLRTRNMIKPIFLYRNLTYMKHRMSRSHKSRKHFKVDSVLHDVTNRLSKQPLNTYLTLTFYGFYSRRALRLGYNEPVKVETLLVKNCHKKRKEITCPVMSVSFGTCTVEMNPNEDSPPLKAPTISIPTEKFMTPAAGAKSFKLVLNVTTSKVVHDYVPTAKDDFDNVIKKRKVGSSDEDEPVKFTKSITLYSKQKCSLTEGDYEIYLELDEKKNKNDTSLSTWEDCNGLLDQEFQERHKDSFQKMLEGPTLKFRLSFEREKINAEVDWPKPLQARDHSVVEKAEGTVERRLNEHKVVYQFLYNSNSRQQTEASYDMHCPWCSVDCKVLYSLLKHLRLCHPRFNFNYVPVQGGVRIDISVNETYDGSSWNTLGGIMLRGSGPVKRQPCTTIIVCRPKRSSHNLSEFINAEEEAPRPYITGHNRLYHHTTTCLPIYPKEMDLDSEDETDPSWLRQKTQMMIDEFTDVNEGEKELMKMWNLHVMKHGFVGDVQVQLACEMFLQERGKELLSKNLYRNFVVHMCNLFDFGLVSPLTVFKIMQQVQDIIQIDPKLNRILQECWTAQREHWNPAEQAPKQENRAKSCQQSQDSSGPSRRKPAQDEKGKRRRGRRMAQSSKPDLRSKDSSNKKSAVSS